MYNCQNIKMVDIGNRIVKIKKPIKIQNSNNFLDKKKKY